MACTLPSDDEGPDVKCHAAAAAGPGPRRVLKRPSAPGPASDIKEGERTKRQRAAAPGRGDEEKPQGTKKHKDSNDLGDKSKVKKGDSKTKSTSHIKKHTVEGLPSAGPAVANANLAAKINSIQTTRGRRLLELFSGTGSIGKSFEAAGWTVVSLDISDKPIMPTFQQDIMEWNFRMFPPKFFDVIWSSPPCTQYSRARTTAKTPRDLEGADAVVSRTRQIKNSTTSQRSSSSRTPRVAC
jgi:hypothetical protein